MNRTLYLTMSGAPAPGAPVTELVRLLQDHGWSLTVLSTPAGVRFHDLDAFAAITGESVRVQFCHPVNGRSLPHLDALVACLWTCNIHNNAALWLSDLYVDT